MTDHYTQYIRYHVSLLQQFKETSQSLPPFTHNELCSEDDDEFIETLNELCQIKHYSDTANERGQWLVGRIVSAYSHLTHLLPRGLLWFFGGGCLHYMPDNEIDFYHQLDELRFAAEATDGDFDYAAAVQQLHNKHLH